MTRSDTSKPSLNRVDFHFKENEEIVWGLSGNSINPIWTVLKEHQVVLGSTKYTCILLSYTACKLYIYITYIHKCQTLSPFQSPLIKRSTLRPSTTLFYIKKTSASWLYDIILPRWASRPPFFLLRKEQELKSVAAKTEPCAGFKISESLRAVRRKRGDDGWDWTHFPQILVSLFESFDFLLGGGERIKWGKTPSTLLGVSFLFWCGFFDKKKTIPLKLFLAAPGVPLAKRFPPSN